MTSMQVGTVPVRIQQSWAGGWSMQNLGPGTVYLDNVPGVSVATGYPVIPGRSLPLDSGVTLWAVSDTSAMVSTVLGVSTDSATIITGDVTATVSGPVDAHITNATVPVAGNVGITGVANVNVNNASIPVSGSVNATIQNATVPVSGNVGISGTANVNVSNASIPVSGSVNATIQNASVPIAGNVGITGTPTVQFASGQKVDINNTPSVNIGAGNTIGISGTPSVAISGTPSVNIANASVPVSGSVNVGSIGGTVAVSGNMNVTNSTLNVAGNVGINPNKNTLVNSGILPAGTTTYSTAILDVSKYQSMLITSLRNTSPLQSYNGATLDIVCSAIWYDASNNLLYEEKFTMPGWGSGIISTLVKGVHAQLTFVSTDGIHTLQDQAFTWTGLDNYQPEYWICQPLANYNANYNNLSIKLDNSNTVCALSGSLPALTTGLDIPIPSIAGSMTITYMRIITTGTGTSGFDLRTGMDNPIANLVTLDNASAAGTYFLNGAIPLTVEVPQAPLTFRAYATSGTAAITFLLHYVMKGVAT